MESFTIDPARSTLTLRTRAGGFFGALAHDLELSAKLRGEVKREGDVYSGEVVVEPSSIKVVGVIKRGRVDASVLSGSDVREIERRVAEEIFARREIVAKVGGTLDRPDVRVTVKREGAARLNVKRAGDAYNATGTVSIKSLGLDEVKGPLGAFVVKDDVEIDATVTLAPA